VGKKPGPLPTPTNVVALRGNPSGLTDEELAERRAAEEAIPARPLRPKAPEYLSPYAREGWDRIVPALEHLGLLTELDGLALEMGCNAYAACRYALDEMRPKKSDGSPDGRMKRLEVTDVDLSHRGNTKRSSAFAAYMQASRDFRSWCIEFGLTPSARASLRPAAGAPRAGEGAAADDDDDAFFGT
jgi:P27 family predicted phage terminase small subunit